MLRSKALIARVSCRLLLLMLLLLLLLLLLLSPAAGTAEGRHVKASSAKAMSSASDVAAQVLKSPLPILELLHAMGVAASKKSSCWRRLRLRHDAENDSLESATLS